MITLAAIDRALELLIRADVPLLLENHVRGQVDVLMSLDCQTAGLHTSIALQVGRKLARLGRVANTKVLLMAARELGVEDDPTAPAEQDKATTTAPAPAPGLWGMWARQGDHVLVSTAQLEQIAQDLLAILAPQTSGVVASGTEHKATVTVTTSSGIGDARVEVTVTCGDQVHRLAYEQAVVDIREQPGRNGTPDKLQLELTGSRVRTPAT